MEENIDSIDQKARAFYWSRNPGKIMMEDTRPDMVIGYRAGYEQAIVDKEQEVSHDAIEFAEWLDITTKQSENRCFIERTEGYTYPNLYKLWQQSK